MLWAGQSEGGPERSIEVPAQGRERGGRVRHELVASGAPPAKMSTFKRSLLGTTLSYEGLAEHGKRYIPKLAGKRVPDPFRRLFGNTKISKLIKVKKLKMFACK